MEQNGPTEIDSYKYSQLIFDKGAEAKHRTVFSINGAGTNRYPRAKKERMDLDTALCHSQKLTENRSLS